MFWKLAPWLAYVLGFVLINYGYDEATGSGGTMSDIGVFMLLVGMVLHIKFWGKALFLIVLFLGGALVGFKLMKD